MPLLLTIPYVFTEALAFWGVAHWIGTGWALLLLFAFFIIGILLVRLELRKLALKASRGQEDPGTAVGDLGLILAGCLLLALPGFVSGILGLLLVLSPTRGMFRRLLARKVRNRIENIGIRTFERTGQFRHFQYGDVRPTANPDSPHHDTAPDVIDETEIQRWTENLTPEDFQDAPKNGDSTNHPDQKNN
ncbi:FxsA family protein [Corynebacterium poyangense]|uniref:FxsA family protein n=1 Tax=Corynebacterium poyangense TaxID=2684405 RepID=A0A7H0SNT6_9CORY|nr:FxsA family protein [Corynebacterium poyangense]MBZ8177763.1 FxsA family protein [Corynebacterium poyangense]QNQ90211.1 FxsA family protein [Corynebacterium poyangense]